MAIAVRAAQGSENGTGGTTITMTVPTGTVDGDVMLMVFHINNAGAPASISGWTNLRGGSNASLYWRIAASEPASYAVTITSGKAAGVILSISGADNTQPTNTPNVQYDVKNTIGSATITGPLISFGSTKSGLDVFFGGINNGTTTGQPAGYAEPTNGSATSSGGGGATGKATCGVATKAVTSVSSIAALTATYGASGNNEGFHILIFEAAGAPPIAKRVGGLQAVNRASTY